MGFLFCEEIMGVYGKFTREKQNDFKAMLSHHINVVKHIHNKTRSSWIDKRYLYIDVFGGPGRYDPDGNGEIDGSPLIAESLLSMSEIDYLLYAIESDEKSYDKLRRYIKNGDVILGDSFVELESIGAINNVYGMIYFDCSMELDNVINTFDLIKSAPICKSRMLDIMVYISGNNYKRHRNNKNFVHLSDIVCDIPKRYKIIKKLKWSQYTFLIFTNDKGWATWAGRGWYDVGTKQGRNEWRKFIYFQDEINQSKKKETEQLPLIGLMQNTCDIQHLELLERKQSGGLVGFARDAIATRLRKFIT
jgi:hypothetical protein